MASDSAGLLETPPPAEARPLARSRPKGPAKPVLEGVGLDAPFFSDKNKAFWVLQTTGWTGYFILRSLSGIANSMGAIFVVHTLLLTALLSLSVVILASFSFSFIETWSFATFLKPNSRPVGVEYLGAILLNFSLLAAWSALYYGINYYLLLEEEIDQRARLEGQASSAQLAMLRYQLNPHFLFNTLNSISTLVLLKQTERANAMLARLSSFLRYTLVNEPTAQVTLAQEVETLKLYLEIEKMRFEDRLRPHFRIDPSTIGARLPSLLLQPLVENAIKYAVTPSEDGADIWVKAERQGSGIRIEVADSGPGSQAGLAVHESTGVGLANIKDRLAQAYGAAHAFQTRQNEHGGFSVTLDIPFEGRGHDIQEFAKESE